MSRSEPSKFAAAKMTRECCAQDCEASVDGGGRLGLQLQILPGRLNAHQARAPAQRGQSRLADDGMSAGQGHDA